jgi:hypothetical protein
MAAQRGFMSKKWYNYFVSVDQAGGASADESADSDAPVPPASAAQSVAEIAQSVAAPPKFTPSSVSNPNSFDEIYQAAEIPAAPQGYSILKVSEMLQSEHIRSLPADVKRSSVLVALDAAGVDIKDVIQDAVRRDRALDVYESVQQRAVEDLEARKTKENNQIQTEIDRMVAEQKAKIQKNNDDVAQEKERFFGWRLKKQQEEKKISDAVSYFVTENPITTGPANTSAPAAAAPKTAKQK